MKPRILLASPVRQVPEVLDQFLASLGRLTKDSFELDFAFVDDNTDEVSKAMLHTFASVHQARIVQPESIEITYNRHDFTHVWTDQAIWKVAAFKDGLIEYALEQGYHYLFLVDSDLVLHPFTIEQLLRAEKNIVTEIFWTSWQPGTIPGPQVWIADDYKQTDEFLAQLKVPGVYEVGGLGACTLISREALERGVRFARIPNLTLWGEDRHFCVRAKVLGLDLFVDTHLPALHLYRSEDLSKVDYFVARTNDFTSRFVREADDFVQDVIVPLHPAWWSRPREYGWAERLVSPDHVVLDAACGISHPFKFWLAALGAETHVCELDARIMSTQLILDEIERDLGSPAAEIIRGLELVAKLRRSISNLTNLRCYKDEQFDRIFCISVIEHMTPDDVSKAMAEFRRVLKPEGLLVLTFDVPPLVIDGSFDADPGFEFAGPVDKDLPPDALCTGMYGGELRCFRAVLRKVTPDAG